MVYELYLLNYAKESLCKKGENLWSICVVSLIIIIGNNNYQYYENSVDKMQMIFCL